MERHGIFLSEDQVIDNATDISECVEKAVYNASRGKCSYVAFVREVDIDKFREDCTKNVERETDLDLIYPLLFMDF